MGGRKRYNILFISRMWGEKYQMLIFLGCGEGPNQHLKSRDQLKRSAVAFNKNETNIFCLICPRSSFYSFQTISMITRSLSFLLQFFLFLEPETPPPFF